MDIVQQYQWQKLNPSKQPSPHRGSNLVFDSKRQQAVLVAAGEIWLWNGVNWSQVQGQTLPPARNTTHLVYDTVTECVLLFGGIGVDGTPLNDTWLWNGVQWTEQRPTNYPSSVGGAALACDAASKQVLLFGGLAGFDGFNGSNRVGTFSDETWTWDGRTWKMHETSNPPLARIGAQMVYDEPRQQVLLFGGNSLVGYLNDTWLWNGSGWSEIHPSAAPPAGARYSGTFHQQLQQVMLLGELTSDDNLAQRSYQIWQWDGSSWSQSPMGVTPGGRIEGFAYDGARNTIIAHIVNEEKVWPVGKNAGAAFAQVAAPALTSETWIWR